jgi:hypothetical protein
MDICLIWLDTRGPWVGSDYLPRRNTDATSIVYRPLGAGPPP